VITKLSALPALVLVAACGGVVEVNPPPATVVASTPALAPSAVPVAALPAPVEDAIVRVQGLFVDPSDAAIAATFSPTFLAAVPPDKVKGIFTAAKAQVGTCKEHRAEQVKNETSATVRLQCERGAVSATIVVNPAPAHLVDGLLIKPAL
jgi:hypothetical protein